MAETMLISKTRMISFENDIKAAQRDGALSLSNMRDRMAYDLAQLFKGEAHKVAGFKSFKQYVEARFPFDKPTASQMCTWARTGLKWLTTDESGALVNLIAPGLDLSVAERFNSIDTDVIKKAVEAGEITASMKEDEAKKWVQSYNQTNPRKSSKPKVVTIYQRVEEDDHNALYFSDEDAEYEDFTGSEPEHWNTLDGLKTAGPDEIHVHTWKMDDGAVYRFSVNKNGCMDGSAWMPKKPEPKKHPVGKSKEEIAADALKALDPETLKALVAKILG